MRVVIDSNRYIDLCRGVPGVVEVIEDAEAVYIPSIVLAEQRVAFAFGFHREKNERTLTSFLNTAGIFVLAPNDQTTFFYADLYLFLSKMRPVSASSLWIAALALQHQLVLFDRNSDFDHLPQLARISV